MKQGRRRGFLNALLMLLFTLVSASPIAARAEGAAPAEIKIGHLHAGSGPYASISMPVYDALKLWVDQQNAAGGAFVKAFNKKIPLKLISYDDQSNPGTAATLINQLITQDKVDLLVCDSGSVLTAVAVPIAREHKMFLFDPTGTGAAFFSKDNPYIALLADPVSTVWPRYLWEFLKSDAAALGLKRVAILYATNDFTGTQASAIRAALKEPGSPSEIVFDQGVPTSTSNYSVLIDNIAATNPDIVLELGYVGNDIAFLRNLQDQDHKFKAVFTLYPGIETNVLMKNVGAQGLAGVFTYVTALGLSLKPEIGMTVEELRAAFEKAYGGGGVEFGWNAIAGHVTGLVIGETLAHADSLSQADLRQAVFGLSGKLKTLVGTFELREDGAQIGELTPIGQFGPDGKLAVVYPHEFATAKPKINAP
jgi:branched-chain amino acid transport system substrate-binding protein